MEILDIYDENGNVIGSAERKVVHQNGLWHIHVGILLMNEKGEILFQQRSLNKKINPGKWTRTGGHVESGETPAEGLQREVEEEIGVKIPLENIELMGIEKEEASERHKQFVYSYFAYVNFKIDEYVLQEEEVKDIKYVSIEEMKEILKRHDDSFTFIEWENIDDVIKYLEEKRKFILEKQ